jgi:hypothetical protein
MQNGAHPKMRAVRLLAGWLKVGNAKGNPLSIQPRQTSRQPHPHRKDHIVSCRSSRVKESRC